MLASRSAVSAAFNGRSTGAAPTTSSGAAISTTRPSRGEVFIIMTTTSTNAPSPNPTPVATPPMFASLWPIFSGSDDRNSVTFLGTSQSRRCGPRIGTSVMESTV